MAESDDLLSVDSNSRKLPAGLFADLGAEIRDDLESELDVVELPGGQALFHNGDPGDFMAFVTGGMLEVALLQPQGHSLRLDVLEPGATAGETALLTGQPRSADVAAMVDSRIARLSREGYARLARKFPASMESFSQKLLPRIQHTQLAGVLTALFGPLEPQALNAIRRQVTWRRLTAGEVLMHKGDPGDSMYIVVSGRLKILGEPESGEGTELGEVARGEMVGEYALLTGEPRSATVIALRDSDLICLTRETMEKLIAEHPALLLRITQAIVRRRQGQLDLNSKGEPAALVIALLPFGQEFPAADFLEQLSSGLALTGKTLVIDSQRFEDLFGRQGAAQLPPEHPSSAMINTWMSNIESAYRYTILMADGSLTEWTRRCLRQADRLALVGSARGELPAAISDPTWLSNAAEKTTDLVLVHPGSDPRPANTLRWLDVFNPSRVHHVRLGNPADFRRLARRLSGRSIGLALSGGGARGLAHIGAIRAFEEAGLEIDLIGGVSMGSLIGALLAMDIDSAGMLKIARRFASPRKLLDYTLPYSSLVATQKISNFLREIFDELQIEDLWRGFFCLSTNISRAEPLIHQAGSLWEAVRASIAIPGIFAPLLYEGDLLVDGGVMNIFPVDIMRHRCEGGKVIGVNASIKKEEGGNYQFGAGISGWQVLWSKINPLAPKVRAPSILSNLIRSSETSSIYFNTLRQRQADILIQPEVKSFSTLAFGDYEPIIEQGYLAAKASLASIKGLD